MTELTDFLLARIGEDEAVARAILEQDYSEGRWEWQMHGSQPSYRTALINDRGAVVLPPKNDDVYPSAAVADHIARHDPARVLAECAAKKAIVERCSAVDYAMPSTHLAHGILTELAQPYAGEPGWREEWA